MSSFDLAKANPAPNVRLHTLVRLRWLATVGQTVAVLVVYYGLGFELPLVYCLATIALSVFLNIALRFGFQPAQRLQPSRTALLLAFDIAQLGILLLLTGGLENPFAFLFLAPVLISATALPWRFTLMLGGFAATCATALLFVHDPLPWDPSKPIVLPQVYMLGDWISILLAIGFIGVYAWIVSEQSRQLATALTATELVLAREQHLSQLDGLAAAAAHELGTPLSTISVITRELERAIAADSPHGEDVRLLREQAQRCRDILGKLTVLPANDHPFERTPLSSIIEEIVAPHRNFGVEIKVRLPADRSAEPLGTRNPAVIYGLGNVIENAVDFAASRVTLFADWSRDSVRITITDDGPGFPPEIMARIGLPYVTSRRRADGDPDGEESGLGLGLFIAKTFLERSGAALTFQNMRPPEKGTAVEIAWNRADFERRSTFAA